MKKALILSLFITLSSGLFSFVYADDAIYYQNTFNQSTNALTSGVITGQQLGTGLTGHLTGFSLNTIVNGSIGTGVLNFNIYSGTNADCTAGTATIQANIAINITGQTVGTKYQNVVTLATPINLDPSRYYCIGAVTTYSNVLLAGASTNLYTNGICSAVIGSSGTGSCGSAVDLQFALYGTQTASNHSYTVINYPLVGSTTASTQVAVSFTYHAVSADNITSYALLFSDLTQSNSFQISGTAATGDATVNQTLSLTTGHNYNLTAYVCNNSGTCYGGNNTTFSVVTQGGSILNVGAATTSTLGLPATSYGFNLPDANIINDATASSSAQTGIRAFINIPGLLATKVPFGYIWDIRQLYVSAATSSSVYSGVVFDFQSLDISTTTKSFLPARFEVFSTTTVTYYLNGTILALFNTLAAAAVWLALLAYAFYRIKTVFN